MSASVADWEDPFAVLEDLIQTPEQARDWLRFLGQVRSMALVPASEWAAAVPWEQQLGYDPDLLDLVRFIHDAAAQDPASVAGAVCSIDLWEVRARAEWRLGWDDNGEGALQQAMTTEHDRRRSEEHSAAEAALKAAAGPACHPLVNRLSNCAGAAEVAGENRVLRIAGVHLAQRGLSELFESIYSVVIEGAEPGDGRRFLQAEFQP